jgi:hypothetical protein
MRPDSLFLFLLLRRVECFFSSLDLVVLCTPPFAARPFAIHDPRTDFACFLRSDALGRCSAAECCGTMSAISFPDSSAPLASLSTTTPWTACLPARARALSDIALDARDDLLSSFDFLEYDEEFFCA